MNWLGPKPPTGFILFEDDAGLCEDWTAPCAEIAELVQAVDLEAEARAQFESAAPPSHAAALTAATATDEAVETQAILDAIVAQEEAPDIDIERWLDLTRQKLDAYHQIVSAVLAEPEG